MPVNTSDPIGQYARFVLRPSESVLDELLTSTHKGGTAGTTETVGGKLAYKPASTATTWALVETDLDPRVGGDFTFFWYGVLPDDTAQTLMDCSGVDYGWNLLVGTWGSGFVTLDAGTKWGGQGQVAVAIATDGTTPIAVCLVYTDSDRTVKLYVNGSLVKSGIVNTEAGVMGSGQTFSIKGDATKPQKMITLQAFAGALNATDVGTLSSSPFTIFTAPPVTFTADNCTQANASGSGSIGINGALVGANCTQANIAGTGQITRTQDITGSNCIQGNASGAGSIDPYGRLRAIIAATPTHEWVKVSENSFLDVTIPPASLPPPPQSLGNSASVIYAWSSFTWDNANGNLWMFGGGHANYSGNEIYVWKGDSGLWDLGCLPVFVDFSDTISNVIPSRRAPQSSHTYKNNGFLPNNRMFVTFGGAAAKRGGPMDEIVTYDPYVTRKVGPWVFDVSLADPNKVGGNTGDGWDVTVPGSGAWKVRIDSIDAVDPAFTYDLDARSHVGGATVIVDEDGVDVAYTTMDAAGSGFPFWCRYTFGDIRNGGRDTFEKIGTTVGGVMFDGFGVYDSKRGMMYRNSVRMSGNTADILALRVKGATGVTGTTPIQLIDELGADFPLNVWNAAATPPQYVRECFYGATYDAENDRLWLWNGDVSAPGRLYYVQLPDWISGTGWASTTWTVHAVTPAGATPRGNHEHGVLGKMQAVPALGAFVVLDSTTIDRVDDPAVWLFKTSAQNNLSVSGSAQGNASTSVAITRTQDLAGANCSQANTGSAGAISIDSGLDLTAANVVQANEGTGGEITINGALIAAPSVQDNIATASAIVQAHILAAASSSQSNAGSSASIGVGDPIILEVSMSSQANDCSTGEISTSIAFASDPRFISAARPRNYVAGIVH